MRYLLAALLLVPMPALAQDTKYTIDLPTTCNNRGTDCRIAGVVLNPDGTPVGSAARRGAGALATGQVSVGTTSTLVAAARTGRVRIIASVGAANTCAFGNPGVTLTTGFPLQPVAGASVTLQSTGPLYSACSATTVVSFVEEY